MNYKTNLAIKLVIAIVCVLTATLFLQSTPPSSSLNYVSKKDTALPKHFCLIKGPESKPFPITEAISDRNYIWDKNVLNVYFWDKDDWGIFDKVIQIANEWYPYSGIKFKRVYTKNDSHIRVSVKKSGFWSYIGSYAKQISKDSITLSLEKIYLPQNEVRFRNVILHEFGHALGLIHELQHPDLNIPWIEDSLFAFFKKTYNVDSKWVKQQVIEKYKSPTGIYCDADPNSIMIYAIPPGVTVNNAFVSDWPDSLSVLDKKFIGLICKHKKCKP